MIYDQTNGFRNDLSMLDYIKSCGGLKGNGMAYYIEGHDEYKFKMSNFAEKFKTIPEFKTIIEQTAESLMFSSIRTSSRFEPTVQEEEKEGENVEQ